MRVYLGRVSLGRVQLERKKNKKNIQYFNGKFYFKRHFPVLPVGSGCVG